jgi:hypothetical protein
MDSIRRRAKVSTRTFDSSPESVGCPDNGRQLRSEPESSGGCVSQSSRKLTTHWRAGSKKFGSPVRREGERTLSLPLSRGPNALRVLSKRNEAFVRQRYNLPLAKIMRTTTKWGNCGPNINIFFASVSYTSYLPPFQGASPWRAVPRVETWLKPWAESSCPFGTKNHPKQAYLSAILD